MPSPASRSIGRSLAPSPTAMHCSRLKPSLAAISPRQLRLARAVDDRSQHLAGDDAVADVERVGVQVIDAQTLLQHAAEEREAAGEDRGLVAEAAQRRDQPLGAVGERNPVDRPVAAPIQAGP